jgi:hypothetical protein
MEWLLFLITFSSDLIPFDKKWNQAESIRRIKYCSDEKSRNTTLDG